MSGMAADLAEQVLDEVAYGLWTYWSGYIYRKDNPVPRG